MTVFRHPSNYNPNCSAERFFESCLAAMPSDELEGDLASNRFLLLGPAPSFADSLEQFVAADAIAWFFEGSNWGGRTRAGAATAADGSLKVRGASFQREQGRPRSRSSGAPRPGRKTVADCPFGTMSFHLGRSLRTRPPYAASCVNCRSRALRCAIRARQSAAAGTGRTASPVRSRGSAGADGAGSSGTVTGHCSAGMETAAGT